MAKKSKNMENEDLVNEEQSLEAQKESSKKEPKQKPVKMSGYDLNGGRVYFDAPGRADGDTFNVTVNGKHKKLTIEGEKAEYAADWSFKEFPAVEIKD